MLLPFQIVLSALEKADLLASAYIPADFKPSAFLSLEFPSGQSVQLGNTLTPLEGAGEPTISFVDDEPNSEASYALVSFDPDAPSRENPVAGPWRHWIIGGLKPTSADALLAGKTASSVEQTQVALSPWVGPSPPVATGVHRYLFFLYRETKPLLALEAQSTVKSNERIDRRNFDAAKFVKDNGLVLVGANFFLCSNPDQTKPE